ncbi:MAG: hypothetical protein ABSD71_11135, partial [Bacteroidales bacterium]
ELRKLSCWFYILVAVTSILAILTGDGAGEIIRTYPGISNDVIESHETWGYIFFYGLILLGLISIAALWFSRKREELMKKFNISMLILALLVSILAFQAGRTGGLIRHPEMIQGAVQK